MVGRLQRVEIVVAADVMFLAKYRDPTSGDKRGAMFRLQPAVCSRALANTDLRIRSSRTAVQKNAMREMWTVLFDGKTKSGA